MSDATTRRMIAAYNQHAAPTMFFAGMFSSPAANFYNSEEVEIDITRSDEEVSIVVQDIAAGYRMNSQDLYTNKALKAPVHMEAVALNSFDLIKRTAGDNPFENPNFRANLITRAFDSIRKVDAKLRRAVELQASQILQTGQLTLRDNNGVALYTLNYNPKASHFPTAAVSWATATGKQKLDDINSLAEQCRDDGLEDCDELHMGVTAFENLISDDVVKSRYDNRRMDLGTISPMKKNGQGGNYRGIIEVGNYRYDIWTYGGRYNDPQTGNKLPYLDNGKVIVRSSTARMDATFGAIPNIGELLDGGNSRLLPELPGRISNQAGGMDLHTNVWLSADGNHLFVGVGARPLLIPTAIDTFGCLDTQL